MNRDDIIRMAQECGLTVNYTHFPRILHFADRVAAAEREACARVCDELDRRWINQAEKCAERIRAREDK